MCLVCAAVALAGESGPLYAKHDTWPETMTAALELQTEGVAA